MVTERTRKLAQVATAGGALILPHVPWWWSLGAASVTVAVIAALALTPASRVRGRRLPPASLSHFLGYALGVLLLVAAFPARPDLAAAGWGILAAGDAAATLAGRRFVSRRWPWHPQKTLAGSIAFVLVGGTAGLLLATLTRPSDVSSTLAFTALLVAAASVIAAAVETIPIRLEDEVSIAVATTLTLWLGALIQPPAPAELASLGVRTLLGLAASAACATAAVALGGVTQGGATAGVVIGTVLFVGAGPAGLIMLMFVFAAAWLSSRAGLRRKHVLGIAEAREGRRGASNVIANCGLAGMAAIAAAFSPYREAALVALASALVAGASDTVASEIGKAFGGRTVLPVKLALVPPGTPGGTSLAGTVAGIISAALLATAAWMSGLIQWNAIAIVTIAATVGALIEGALAATLEPAGVLNNDVLNFLNTLGAAALALVLTR
jgi:uncharacterized protein (TIGR00297 family)